MANLQPGSQSGLAIFPNLLSSQPLTMTMKSSGLSGDYIFTDNTTSSTLFSLDAKAISMSRRKTLLDANNRPLFHLSKETWTLGYKYSANTPPSAGNLSGTELFRSETHRRDTVLTFINATNNQPVRLEIHNSASMGIHVTAVDAASKAVVANIDKENWKMRHQYQLQVAPGMDPSIVAAIAVILADIRAQKSSSAAAAGGAGGGGGG